MPIFLLLSLPLLHLQSKSQISPGSQLLDEPGHSQFPASTKRDVLLYSQRKKSFQKSHLWLSAHSTEVTSSCVSGSPSNSQLHSKGTSQPKKSPLILGKKGTGSADGCCVLETRHAADPAQICAAQHRWLPEGRAPKIPSPSLKFWI